MLKGYLFQDTQAGREARFLLGCYAESLADCVRNHGPIDRVIEILTRQSAIALEALNESMVARTRSVQAEIPAGPSDVSHREIFEIEHLPAGGQL